MKTWWIRNDDEAKCKTPLMTGEPAHEYDDPDLARAELEDLGGGWLFDDKGRPVEYVKGYKERD